MCSPVRCKRCGKTTWAGCGEHIEEALHGVPDSERCQGHSGQEKSSGFFSRLFGK